MKRTFVVLAVALVLGIAQRPTAAQTPGMDPSGDNGYVPDSYARLMSASVPMSPADNPQPGMQPGPQMGPQMGPQPYPMPESAGDYFGNACGNACGGARWQIAGEILYLRPTNADVPFAQVVNTNAVPQLPIGRTGESNPFYDTGFRISAARALGDCAAIGVTYSYFDTTVNSTVNATENTQLLTPPVAQVRSLVLFPNSPNVDFLGNFAQATQQMRFQLADVDYKAALISGPRYCANFLVGARFASLEQSFSSAIVNAAGVSELMFTNVNFEGGGVRLGLEGERQSANNGFLVYSKGAASFVGGTFRGEYSEFNQATPQLVDTQWRAHRVVTMLDFEVGAGWASPGGALRVTGGYMVSGWFNTVKLNDYIRAVQQGATFQAEDVGSSKPLVFDGLVARIECRF
jgi:hypothetical protein